MGIISRRLLMYQEFFSLKHLPFSISPDPDFLFLSDRHKEALAHLKYGLQSNGGFVLLTGEVGTGKTTICRLLLQQLPEGLDVAFILNPALNEIELLATICDEFNIEYPKENPSLKILFDSLTAWMSDNQHHGRGAVVIIDEAQHLSFAVLEQLRLLTNIESNNKKALQVILIGQTELKEKLAQRELRQLAQRITARYHLLTLTEKETQYYIQHRLNIAGASYPIFDTKVQQRIFKYSHGVPRIINLICDRCLLCAYSENTTKVSTKILSKVMKEVDVDHRPSYEPSQLKHWSRFALLALLILFIGMQLSKISIPPFLSTLVDKTSNTFSHLVSSPTENPVITDGQSTAEKEVTTNIESFSKEANIATEKIEQAMIQAPLAVLPIPEGLVTESIPFKEINSAAEASIWFDDYPLLDLTQGEFAYALRNLYAIWGYQVDLLEVSCEQGVVASLLCFSEPSNIEKLDQLNYPAIIKLNNDDQYLYAVVYKVSDTYQLLIGDQSINVSLQWLTRYWHGGLTLLWKKPFISEQKLKLGNQGKGVLWLAQQLNLIYSLPATSKDIFDTALQEEVKQFQRDHGLVDDGIVGPRTMMLIMQQTHPEFPRLTEEK